MFWPSCAVVHCFLVSGLFLYVYIYIYIYIEDLRGHADGNHLRDMRKNYLTEKLHSLAKVFFFSYYFHHKSFVCKKKKEEEIFPMLSCMPCDIREHANVLLND